MEENWKRLWIALPSDPSCAHELGARLGRGITKDDRVRIEPVLNSDGKCRGFGYITSLEDEGQGHRIVELYHNSKWKGFRLVIAPAKPSILERLRRENEHAEVTQHSVAEKSTPYEGPVPSNQRASMRIRPRPGSELVEFFPRKSRKFHTEDPIDEGSNEVNWGSGSCHVGEVGILDAFKGQKSLVEKLEQQAGNFEWEGSDDVEIKIDDADKKISFCGHSDISGSNNDIPSSHEADLSSELSSEAHRSLSVLSSILGSESLRPVTSKRVGPSASTPSNFQPIERFLGNDDETGNLASNQQESSVFENQLEMPLSQQFEAKWGTLKSVFHCSGLKKAPEFGFASEEDPLSLKGLPSMTERETARQAHSFSFVFSEQLKDETFHEKIKRGNRDCGKSTRKICLWGDFARLEALTSPGELRPFQSISVSDKKQTRQVFLNNTKRALRHYINK